MFALAQSRDNYDFINVSPACLTTSFYPCKQIRLAARRPAKASQRAILSGLSGQPKALPFLSRGAVNASGAAPPAQGSGLQCPPTDDSARRARGHWLQAYRIAAAADKGI